jgi:hypothetical protein
MQEHTFWHILETSAARSANQQNRMAASVIEHLCRLDVEQIIGYAKCFYAFDAKLTNPTFKQVCQSLHPNASLAEFINFRAWIIFQGYDFFRLVLSAPALCHDFSSLESFENRYAWVAVRAYERKTRKRDFYELPQIIALVEALPEP